MGFHPGQPVFAHFPGNTVHAMIVEIGVGEVKVVEDGSRQGDWIPLSWCEARPLADEPEEC